jgi:hypothetical protein
MEAAMKELSRETRALLDAARCSEHLSTAGKARIRSKLSQRIGAGLALGTALSATVTVAEAAHTGTLATLAAWLPTAAKVVSVIAITGAVSVGVVKATRTSAPTVASSAPVAAAQLKRAPRAANLAENSDLALSPAPDAPAAASAGTAASETAVNARSFARSRRSVSGAASTNEAAPQNQSSPAAVAPAEPVTVDRLSHQVAAIRAARAAIRDGDAHAALLTLDREMPQGQAGALAPEAALARVTAYCRLGQTEAARRTAESFLRQYPESPLVARMQESCAGVGSQRR